MRIGVMGAGAMGCLLGGYLARAGHEVALVDPVVERVTAVSERGITVEGVLGDFVARASAGLAYPLAEPPELVLVCVKAYDTDRAGAALAPILGPTTLVLTLQNGIGHLERLAPHVPRDRILAGATALGAHLLAPGHVHHAGAGETQIGEVAGGASARARAAARLLSEAGLDATAVDDVRAVVWGKLAVNVGVNALTAILRLRNGRLLGTPAEEVLAAAVAECVAVAVASGVPLALPATLQRTREVARLTASNRSSMLADVLAGRRTEIDAINGAVAHRGRELGVPVPVNEALTALVRTLEATSDHQER